MIPDALMIGPPSCETRKGIWPPPETLLVSISRSHAHGVKWHTRVVVPAGTFAVHDLFAQPPDSARPQWRPAIAHYRAVAAGYHLGDRATTGHYWALVRGSEPAAACLGYRRCNDAVCTRSTTPCRRFEPGGDSFRWDHADASRRVTLVALERVDGAGVRASLSERLNVLSEPTRPPAGRVCAACTLINATTAHACAACRAPLPAAGRPGNRGGRPAGGRPAGGR